MKRALMTSAVAAAFVGVVGMAIAAPSPAAPGAAKVPEKVDNFQLADQTRLAHELYYFKAAPAIVIMTQTNGSATSRAAAAELEKIQAAYKAKGVLFYMLNSTLGDTRDAVSAEADKAKLDIPILLDERQLVGENLGVSREAEVFVIDTKTWKIAYHGPLDDRFAKPTLNLKRAAKAAYTANAINAVLSGQAIEMTRLDMTVGKTIAFPERARSADFAKISYAKDVAPIVKDKCVTCHQKGGIAPFAMDSYEKVKAWAPMMRETIRTGRMPPYFPDQHIGHFKNDQGLSADQTKTLVHWIEAGSLRGEGSDLLKDTAGEAPEWPTELGKPDVIVDLPAFNVPATGVIEYQNQRVDNPFTKDTWLRAVAIKPGDTSVLHHVVSNHMPDPKLPRSPVPGGSVGSYTPGAQPQIMADNAGAPVPAGGKLNFQMHYTTTGKAVTDHTKVGFYVLKTPPEYIKRSTVIGNFYMVIPAGEARHKEVAYQTFPADAYLYTLYPHAHYRGYHVELMEVDPDGKRSMLLSLPKYDFNWQRDYDPVEPIHIKAGTKLVATWVFDNSPSNKANPDPKVDVRTGEQTFNEMMYFRVNYRWADETTKIIRNDLQTQLMASSSIGMIDTNFDGLVQKEELKGPMASLKAHFEELDTDHNGGLDEKELAAGNVSRGVTRQQPEIPDL